MTLFGLGEAEAEQMMPDRQKADPDSVHYGPKWTMGADCHWCMHRFPDGQCEIMKGIVAPGMACDYFMPRREG